MTTVKVGDKVSFHAGRRGRLTGVVASVRTPAYKMTAKRRRLDAWAELHGVSLPAILPSAVAEVSVDGAVWKVGCGLLTVVGKGDARKAQVAVYEQKAKVADMKAEQRMAAGMIAEEKGLYDLKRGDKVMVKYRDCFSLCEETFVKFSPSGQVGIANTRNKAGVRYIPANIVTKKA
jgi:hypothetical protein